MLPGLIDQHGHHQAGDGEWVGRSWLAFGVTSVVEPGGMPYLSRALAETWSLGLRPGPRLFFAGPQLDGARKYFPFAAHIASDERLDWELELTRQLKQMRSGFLASILSDVAFSRDISSPYCQAWIEIGNSGGDAAAVRHRVKLVRWVRAAQWPADFTQDLLLNSWAVPGTMRTLADTVARALLLRTPARATRRQP